VKALELTEQQQKLHSHVQVILFANEETLKIVSWLHTPEEIKLTQNSKKPKTKNQNPRMVQDDPSPGLLFPLPLGLVLVLPLLAGLPQVSQLDAKEVQAELEHQLHGREERGAP